MLYKPRSAAEFWFAVLAVVEAAAAAGINGRLAILFDDSRQDIRAVYYGGSLLRTVLAFTLISFPYMVVLTYDALAQRNLFTACGLCLYNCWLIAYSAVFIDVLQDLVLEMSMARVIDLTVWVEARPLLLSNVSLIAACTLAQMVITWKLSKQWSWMIFRLLDADVNLRYLYRIHQTLATLLKFDFVLWTGALAQLLMAVRGRTSIEFGITVATIICVLPLLLATSKFMAKENLYGSVLCICIAIAYLAFFIFKFVRMFSPTYQQPYIAPRKLLTTWLSITIAYVIVTIVIMIVYVLNFGHGLKRYLRVTRDAPSSRSEARGTRSQIKYQALGEDIDSRARQSSKPSDSDTVEVFELRRFEISGEEDRGKRKSRGALG